MWIKNQRPSEEFEFLAGHNSVFWEEREHKVGGTKISDAKILLLQQMYSACQYKHPNILYEGGNSISIHIAYPSVSVFQIDEFGRLKSEG